jgi:hypothetical protein
MGDPNYVLITVELPRGTSSVEAAAKALGVNPTSIDPSFGVRVIDPASGKYAIMLDESAVKGALDRKGVSGPFANPRIEPFGPPKP